MKLSSNYVDGKYANLTKLFENIAKDGEEAQFVAYVGGQLVADLACGFSPDSLTVVYSVSKALSAIAVAKMVDQGLLDLDQTVAHYWPEFAAAGKQDITVRQLLSHQGGLPETRAGLTPGQLMDGKAAADLLAAEAPLWRPGAGFGYHALSIGPLVGELCRRITGKTIQEYYDAEVREPADADAYLGLPESLEPRVAELLPQLPNAEFPPATGAPNPLDSHVNRNVPMPFITSREGRKAGLASASGVASARGLAAVFNWATGYGSETPGIAPDTLQDFAQTQVFGTDWVSGSNPRSHGILFMKPTSAIPFGSFQSFGHDGFGGAVVVADPVGQIVYGYAIRRITNPAGMDRRLQPIIDELRAVALA